ncbi:MAG: hypothetical protein AAF399_13015 [Bacteroidota bacterium]
MNEKSKQKTRSFVPKVKGVANHAAAAGSSMIPPPLSLKASTPVQRSPWGTDEVVTANNYVSPPVGGSSALAEALTKMGAITKQTNGLKALGAAGKVAGGIGVASGLSELGKGIQEGDTGRAVQGGADAAASAVGFAGPVGGAFSAGYGAGRVIDEHTGASTWIANNYKDALKPGRDQREKVNLRLQNELAKKNGGTDTQGFEDDWARANYQYSSSKVKDNRDVRMGQLLKETYGHDKQLYKYAQMKYHWQKKSDRGRAKYYMTVKQSYEQKYGKGTPECEHKVLEFLHMMHKMKLPEL